MKKRTYLFGASMLGCAMLAAVAAQAADDVSVEGATTTETTTTTKTEEGVKPRGFYGVATIGGSFFEGAGVHSKIFNNNGDGTSDANEFNPNKIDDENNFMWSIMAGYRMADWLGAEVGWTDIGGFTAIEDAGTRYDKVNPRVDGVEARLRAWIPLGTERVQGIFGPGIFIFSSHGGKKCKGSDQSGCTNGQPGVFNKVPAALDPTEDSGQAFTLAAGLQFQVTDNILIRTEYQHFFSVLDQGVDMVTASVVVGFYDFFGQGKPGDSMGGITVE